VMVELYCRDHRDRADIGSPVGTTGDIGSAVGTGIDAAGAAAISDSSRSAPGDTIWPSPADTGGLCPDCAALLDYARARLARCPYGAQKPTCADCPTHCYKPAMREQMRAVMRYSGPRMLTRHPLLAAAHLIDGRRPRRAL